MYEKCILLVSFCLMLATAVTAEIRNGYGPDLADARECLRQLNRRLQENPDMRDSERRRIAAAMKKHLEVIAHYQLTDALLRQMRMISPDMYDRMDRLTDKRGRPTDIYVRFIPEDKASVRLSGVSFFEKSARDEDASQSQFGEYTVLIEIWICETALHLLAHELGHTQYIVPNLASYRKYYRDTYSRAVVSKSIGHHASDPSGRMAFAFAGEFLRNRRSFRKTSGQHPQHVASIIREVNLGIRESVEDMFDESIASSHSFR